MTKIIDGSRYQIVVQRLVGLTEWVPKVSSQPTETSPSKAVVDEAPLRVIPRIKPALIFSRLECWSTRSRSFRKLQRKLARKEAASSREAAREAARLQAEIRTAEALVQPQTATIETLRQRETALATPAPIRPVEELRIQRDAIRAATKNRLILQTWKKIEEAKMVEPGLEGSSSYDYDPVYEAQCKVLENAREKAQRVVNAGMMTQEFLVYMDWLQARLKEWDLDRLRGRDLGLEGVETD